MAEQAAPAPAAQVEETEALSRARIRSSSCSNAPQGMSFLDGK